MDEALQFQFVRFVHCDRSYVPVCPGESGRCVRWPPWGWRRCRGRRRSPAAPLCRSPPGRGTTSRSWPCSLFRSPQIILKSPHELIFLPIILHPTRQRKVQGKMQHEPKTAWRRCVNSVTNFQFHWPWSWAKIRLSLPTRHPTLSGTQSQREMKRQSTLVPIFSLFIFLCNFATAQTTMQCAN